MSGRIHLGAGQGYTACGIYIPELPEGERYWYPPHEGVGPATLEQAWNIAAVRRRVGNAHPVTCEWCLAGKAAPIPSTHPRVLRLFTVYDHPRDFPDEFVVREHLLLDGRAQPGELVARAGTLVVVREMLLEKHPGLHRLPRSEGDEPQIVESWV